MTQTGFVSFATRAVRQRHPTGRRGWPRVANLALTLAATLVAAPVVAQTPQGTVSGSVVVEGAQRPLPGRRSPSRGKPASARPPTRPADSASAASPGPGDPQRPGARLSAETQTVNVGSTNVRFVMSERAVELNQVVVTGTAGGEQRSLPRYVGRAGQRR